MHALVGVFALELPSGGVEVQDMVGAVIWPKEFNYRAIRMIKGNFPQFRWAAIVCSPDQKLQIHHVVDDDNIVFTVINVTPRSD